VSNFFVRKVVNVSLLNPLPIFLLSLKTEDLFREEKLQNYFGIGKDRRRIRGRIKNKNTRENLEPLIQKTEVV
jgi:hypothetical protein